MNGHFDSATQTGAVGHLAEETACLVLGAGVTFALFFGVAHLEDVRTSVASAPIEDLHQASAIIDPPPPKVEDRTAAPEMDIPLTGIDIGTSASPVKVSVVPPDLEKIMPSESLPPIATIQFGQVMTELKPKIKTGGELEHIYQQSEVDVAPKAMKKEIARIPDSVHHNIEQLRVTLVLVIDSEGAVTSIRVARPSGNARFDKIVTECVRDEWQFSPAIRKGKKVRCMVEQLVWYKWTEGISYTL
jgi:TonB family protein